MKAGLRYRLGFAESADAISGWPVRKVVKFCIVSVCARAGAQNMMASASEPKIFATILIVVLPPAAIVPWARAPDTCPPDLSTADAIVAVGLAAVFASGSRNVLTRRES